MMPLNQRQSVEGVGGFSGCDTEREVGEGHVFRHIG